MTLCTYVRTDLVMDGWTYVCTYNMFIVVVTSYVRTHDLAASGWALDKQAFGLEPKGLMFMPPIQHQAFSVNLKSCKRLDRKVLLLELLLLYVFTMYL